MCCCLVATAFVGAFIQADMVEQGYRPEPEVEPVVAVVTPDPVVDVEPELTELGKFKLTAYCSCSKCCGKWADNRPKDEFGNDIVYGASGAKLTAGYSLAVDPKLIPYGTKLVINGEIYEAQDCGGAIKNNRIDVYFNNHSDAVEFGVQYANVFML